MLNHDTILFRNRQQPILCKKTTLKTGSELCSINEMMKKQITKIDTKGNPVWMKDDFTCCLGCIHRCPKQRIQYEKKTEKTGRYTNPNVSL